MAATSFFTLYHPKSCATLARATGLAVMSIPPTRAMAPTIFHVRFIHSTSA